MHRTETPPRPAPAAGQRGFTVIEVTLALFVTAEIIVAGLALFDFHNKLARVQAQVSDMQQALRVAQYDMVRMTRMAGRGGVPAIVQLGTANVVWGAVSVRNNVGTNGVSDSVAIGFAGTPLAVDGTDILKLRGVFSSTVYQVNSTVAGSLTLLPAGSTPATATSGKVVVCAYTATGVAQNLTPLISTISAEASAGQTDALLMNSPLSDSIYAVVEVNPSASVVTGNQAACSVPAWVTTAPTPNGVALAFNIASDTLSNAFQTLSSTASVTGLPAQMTSVSSVGILEEYRYYVRQDYVVPGNANSDPAPHLSRARMYPATELPYQNNATNLQADIADSVLDLQVSLGVDLNGDGIIEEDNPPDTNDEWLGNAVGDILTPMNGLQIQQPLHEVRITLLVKTDLRDPSYQGPLITQIEDHVYAATTFPNTQSGRAYRNRQLQTVVGLRNL
jgi:Tfp pilus assembly protein PilW